MKFLLKFAVICDCNVMYLDNPKSTNFVFTSFANFILYLKLSRYYGYIIFVILMHIFKHTLEFLAFVMSQIIIKIHLSNRKSFVNSAV